MASPSGNFAFAPVPSGLNEALGTEAMTIFMSAATMAKQKAHHPELTLAEYASVRHRLAQALAYRNGEYHLVLIMTGERIHKVVLKVTRARDEVFVVSIHRGDEKTLRGCANLPRV